MRRLFFRLTVATLTFAVGAAAAWFGGLLPRFEMSLWRAAPRYVFTPAGRACGDGYTQGYALADGRKMSEGSACYESPERAREELQALTAGATKVIERVPKFKNRFGDEGERIVLLSPPDESGEGRASILWYGGGKCFLFIDAPALDVALGFEKANAYAY